MPARPVVVDLNFMIHWLKYVFIRSKYIALVQPKLKKIVVHSHNFITSSSIAKIIYLVKQEFLELQTRLAKQLRTCNNWNI